MEGIQEIVIVIKVHGNNDFSYEYINQAAVERTKLVESDKGKSIYDVETKELADYFTKNHQQVVDTKEKLTFENSFFDSDDNINYSEVKLTPLFNKDKVSYIVILVHDITDKKKAEIELKTSREVLQKSKLRYESLFQYNIDTIFSLNLKGEILLANLAIKGLTGFNSEEVIGFTPKDFVIKEDKEKIKIAFDKAINGDAISINVSITDRDYILLDLIVKFIPIIVRKKTTGVYAILRDITEEKDLVEKLMESEKHFRIIAENSDDLISLVSIEGKIDYISPSIKKILGYETDSLTNINYIDLIHEEDHIKCKAVLKKSVKEKTTFKTLYRLKNWQDNWVWMEMATTPVFDKKGVLVHIVAISRDMTKRLKYEERLKYLASHDFLTDLENRRSFKERLDNAIARYHKKPTRLALLMIDIDYFKTINDLYGHDVGDTILSKFANQLKDILGKNNLKFRFGGDEFAAIIENTSKEEIIRLISIFQDCLRKPWQIDDMEIKITTSIGVAFVEGKLLEALNQNRIIKQADRALYEAKDAGRNCYEVRDLF